MRGKLLLALPLAVAGFLTYSLTQGQDRTIDPARPPVAGPAERSQVIPAAAPSGESTVATLEQPAGRDPAKFTPLQRQVHIGTQRGADWLFRMNGVKGRFQHGYLPALKVEMEGDNFLRQAAAASTLAHAARFFNEDRYAARATQAILTLLEETATDPNDARVRHTTLPSLAVNRLGAAGLLVQAINNLPSPQPDLLDVSEQLCNFIRRQARVDGSLACLDDAVPPPQPSPTRGEGDNGVQSGKTPGDDAELVNQNVGPALLGLVRSHRFKPAPWKLDLVRKAAAYYRVWWKSNPGMAFVGTHAPAMAEAYLLTRDRALADFVFEMNDWLCVLQYDQIDPRRLAWYGGFKGWSGGAAIEGAPNVGSAIQASSLADACRVAREIGDAQRHPRYCEGLERCLQFLATLQYSDANTQHFADWYRPRLVGAFHASHQDGNLRIDFTQQAVDAQALYLEHVAR